MSYQMAPGSLVSHIISLFAAACEMLHRGCEYSQRHLPGGQARIATTEASTVHMPRAHVGMRSNASLAYLDLISVYGGGGSEGVPVEFPILVGFCGRWPWGEALGPSSCMYFRFKNSCLFVHCCWLAAKPSLCAGGGGGSVIFVMRYAVEASAIP
jgi:hypothetical protein